MALVVLNKNSIFSCLVSVGKVGFSCATVSYRVFLKAWVAVQSVMKCISSSVLSYEDSKLTDTAFVPRRWPRSQAKPAPTVEIDNRAQSALAYALAAIGRENIKNEPTQAIHLTFRSRRYVYLWLPSGFSLTACLTAAPTASPQKRQVCLVVIADSRQVNYVYEKFVVCLVPRRYRCYTPSNKENSPCNECNE